MKADEGELADVRGLYALNTFDLLGTIDFSDARTDTTPPEALTDINAAMDDWKSAALAQQTLIDAQPSRDVPTPTDARPVPLPRRRRQGRQPGGGEGEGDQGRRPAHRPAAEAVQQLGQQLQAAIKQLTKQQQKTQGATGGGATGGAHGRRQPTRQGAAWAASAPAGSYAALPIISPSTGPLAQLVEQETLNLKVAGSIPARPIFRPLARDRADDQQQQDRAADRDQPGPEVEEVVDVADAEGARQEAAQQGAEDADRGGADAAAGLGAAGDHRSCNGPANSPKMIQAMIPTGRVPIAAGRCAPAG